MDVEAFGCVVLTDKNIALILQLFYFLILLVLKKKKVFYIIFAFDINKPMKALRIIIRDQL